MSRLRRLRGTILYGPPLGPVARRLRPRALVLAYHRIATAACDPFALCVRDTTFRAHLQALRQRWRIVSLPALAEQAASGGFEDGSIAVTFDDGYVDNLETAVPLAAREGVPLTIFVTAAPVLQGEPLFWWDRLAAHPERERLHPLLKRAAPDERARILATLDVAPPPGCGRPMTGAELRLLASRPGVTIGAHSMTHAMLATLSPADQLAELQRSRETIESLLQRPVTLASYPFGQRTDVSAETEAAARAAGYRAAFTARGRAMVPGGDTYALPRLMVHECDAATLVARVRQTLRAA